VGLGIGALIGVAEERLAVRPVAFKGINAELVTMVGWATAMEGIVLFIWGENPLAVTGVASNSAFMVLGTRVTAAQVVIVAFTLAVALGLHFWSHRSLLRIACLASSEDRDSAVLRGINVKLLGVGAFAVAGGMLVPIGDLPLPWR
jgi:branched-chain amino acid transport system permease protein